MRFIPKCESLESRLCLDAAHPIPLGHGIVGPALAYQDAGGGVHAELDCELLTYSVTVGSRVPAQSGYWVTAAGTCSGSLFQSSVLIGAKGTGNLVELDGQVADVNATTGAWSVAAICAYGEAGSVSATPRAADMTLGQTLYQYTTVPSS